MAPSALAKASAGFGGVRLRGGASGDCGGLGLGLGPGGDAVHHPGIHPPVRRLAVETPEVQQRRPSWRRDPGLPHPLPPPPPKPSPCQQWATNRQWVPPPFFRSGVKMLVCANSNIFTPLSGEGGAPPPTAYSSAPATHVATPTTPRPPPGAGACPGGQPPPPRPPVPTAPPPTAGGAPAPTKTGEFIPDSPGR